MRIIALPILCLLSAAAFAQISPDDLEYEGAFKLPGWKPGPRWGYGAAALVFNPAGDDGRGTLIGSSHPHHYRFGSCTIPTPAMPVGDTEDAVLRMLPAAVQVQPWTDITGRVSYITRRKFDVNGNLLPEEERGLGLDRMGGLAIIDDWLYWCFFRYYAVQPLDRIDDPTHGRSRLDFTQPEGPWRIGEPGNNFFHQKKTANYMARVPKEWADAHVNGWQLACGKGDGAGSGANSHGPTLIVANHNNPSEAAVLLHYTPPNDIPDWSACDKWEGFVWTEGPNSTVMFAGTRGLGEDRYGAPEAGDCRSAKGYNCDPYGAHWLLYDPDEFVAVLAGAKEVHEPRPYASIDLESIFDKVRAHCEPKPMGAAYDPKTGRIFLVQGNQENGVVHVWKIRQGVVVEPDPDPDPDDPDDPPTAELEARVAALEAQVGAQLAELGRLNAQIDLLKMTDDGLKELIAVQEKYFEDVIGIFKTVVQGIHSELDVLVEKLSSE